LGSLIRYVARDENPGPRNNSIRATKKEARTWAPP
jgi:hypothetical protein